MTVLITTIPHVPGYFNAAYNMAIFQVSAYLRKNYPEIDVVARDCAALNCTWKDVANLIHKQDYELIAILGDYDSVDSLERLLYYIKELSPKSKTLIFGRLPMQIPEFFEKYGIDFIAHSGDFEINALSALRYLQYGDEPSGTLYKIGQIYREGSPAKLLSPESFVFPDPSEVPYDAYYNLYKDDNQRYCGIPNRKELVVHVSRGCPIGCEFCDVQLLQGRMDRRVSPRSVVDYLEENKDNFEYASFFSAIFTLKKRWIEEFCKLMIAHGVPMPWKCVTTTFSLKQCDLAMLREAGCVRIGLGIETLEDKPSEILPKHKLIERRDLDYLLKECRKNDIEINAFLMCGIKDETKEGLESTINYIESLGARARLSLYTPYETLNPDMTLSQVSQLNRQTYTEDSLFDSQHKQFTYDLLYKRRYRESKVQNNVPVK